MTDKFNRMLILAMTLIAAHEAKPSFEADSQCWFRIAFLAERVHLNFNLRILLSDNHSQCYCVIYGHNYFNEEYWDGLIQFNYNLVVNMILSKVFSRLQRLQRVTIRFGCASIPREQVEYDVLVVGGGVAGLSTAIRLKQKEQETGRPISVCVVEKGTEIGDHILSGNCFEPRAFDELFPDWRSWTQNKPPIETEVTSDNFYFLYGKEGSIKIPQLFFPKTLDNHGNYVISLGKLAGWMGEKASELGVDIFTGTPASQVLYHQDGAVKGIATQDFGISKKGQQKDNFTRGIEVVAKQTVFAEGARGSLSQKIIDKFNLRQESDPPIYGIGLKQVWEVDAANPLFQPGYVQHTVGWPVGTNTYSGTFLYHMKPNLIHIGMVVGLNYKNPYLNPYEEFQTFKTHPQIRKFLQGGQCISYGARALSAGGFFSLPKLTFPGGVLVGCSAGFMNVLKIKGSHTAIKSGYEAANAIFDTITDPGFAEKAPKTISLYQKNMEKSWVWEELHSARNIKNSFKNLYTGLLYGGIYKFLKGREPFDLRNKVKDCDQTQKSRYHKPIEYAKHDRKLTFDLLDNLARSGTNHEHDQPSHLVVKQDKKHIPQISLSQYAAPEERFCPAKVYEFVDDGKGGKQLQINAQNCLHCKTCSIKMVEEYIDWRVPEGNGGPKYNFM